MTEIILIFLVVFALNLMPAFAPPTWMVLSFFGLLTPGMNAASLAVVGATAATLGRINLAKFSRVIIRRRFLSDATRHNIDAIKHGIENRRALTFGAFLAYAFSPFPSNYLFIAYGLTELSILFLAVPFFVGRLASYAFWVTTVSAVGDRLELDWIESAPYFTVYFILSQLLLVPAIYGFVRFDWRAALSEEKWRWFRGPPPTRGPTRISV